MAKMYYDSDADLGALKDKTIAVIGYGSQGHAQAQNLRESGLTVIVAELPGTENFELAKSHKFAPVSAKEAAEKADVIQVLAQDHIQAKLYYSDVEPSLKKGKTLVFSHGFNIHFGQIAPPKDVDVIMVAPKGPGHLVRSEYAKGAGVPSLIAVHNDASGKAKQTALAYAKGIGATRAGVIETTFKEETETDLFGEQCVLCGGAAELVRAGFDTLVAAGYQPEIAYFECLHEVKLIVDLIYSGGMMNMWRSVSNTAEFGGLTTRDLVINEESKAAMEKMLDRICSGEFAKEWLDDAKKGMPRMKALEKAEGESQVEKVGTDIRALFESKK